MFVHEYFNRNSSDWAIIEFLKESKQETLRKKIDSYLKSLRTIIDSEPEGKRKKRARKLLDAYEMGDDQKVAKNWEKAGKMSDVSSINVQNPIIFGDGTIYGETINGGMINSGVNNTFTSKKRDRDKVHEDDHEEHTIPENEENEKDDMTSPSTKRSRTNYGSSYSPSSPEMERLPSLATDSIFDNDDDEINVIRDVHTLPLENRNPEDDFHIEGLNISQLFRQYQNESINLANSDGLYVETNVHEILALTSIFMLSQNSHSEMMMNIFGSNLLDKITKKFSPTNKRELDAECESKFRKVIKQSIKDSRDNAVDSLLTHLANPESNLKENLGFIFLEGLRSLPSLKLKSPPSEMTLIVNYLDYIMKGLLHQPDKHRVEWPNTGLKESKARKLEGRARQPDFLVSAIHQLETSGTLFIGEVTSPAEKGNVHKNCNDLIRIGVFMKECIDSAIDKGADIKLLGFQCIEYSIDFYAMELSAPGLYFMYHIGQASIPTSVKTLTHFIDDVEIFLTARDIFRESFVKFYDNLCDPKEATTKALFKRETLSTPSFNQLVSNTRNVKRKCSFWFGRF